MIFSVLAYLKAFIIYRMHLIMVHFEFNCSGQMLLYTPLHSTADSSMKIINTFIIASKSVTTASIITMARLNSSLRFTLININIIFAVFGVFLLAISIYLLTGNFGKLDPGFFIGAGLVIALTGTSIAFGACLGCQGAANQGEKLSKFIDRNCQLQIKVVTYA